MNSRVIGADTFNLKYDAENRLAEVKKNNAVIATFTFDADGKRVKSVMGSETILFVGAHFEIKNGNQITKYYMAGSTRIAMRKYTAPEPMTVEYMLSDHLGSTSLTTDANGAKVLELRYKAWGEIRATWTNVPVDIDPAYKMPLYQYTGQASYMDDPLTGGVTEGFGLMFYNARWYDPYLNHFVQADTIIPGGVQGLDRYAYVRNNPMRMIDPTGHQETEHTEGGGGLYCADGSTAGRSGCGKPDKGEKEVLAKPNEEPYEISPGVYASCHYTGSARTLTCTSVTTYTLTAEQALELQYAIRDRMLTFDQGLGFAFGFIPKWAYEVGIGVANALVVSNLDDVSRMLDDAVYTSLATKEDAQIEVRITQDFVVKVGNEYIVNPTNMIEVNSSNATAASPVFMWSPSGFDLQTLILNVLY